MSIAGIIVLAIVILFALLGMKKGLVKKLSGVLSVVIAALLVNFLLPYVTQAIKTQTPVYNILNDKVQDILEKQVLSAAISGNGGQGASSGSAIDRDRVKSLLSQYGMDASQVDYLSDSELQSYVDQYFQDYKDVIGEAASGSLDSLSKVDQTKLIKDLPVPDFLQRMMINYNNSEGYRSLGASDFTQYLVRFISNIILNIVAFLVTMLITWLIVWVILAGLNLFSHLPVIGAVNRIGGLILGALQGLFIVWLIFLVISLLSGTQFGLSVQNMINDSLVLQPIYESNGFLRIVTNAIGSIM